MIEPLIILVGAATGLLVGLTGVGGGALTTPILLLFFGVAPATAIATDLWYAAITKTAGMLSRVNSHQVDWQILKRMWLGSLPSSLIVVLIVSLGNHLIKNELLNKSIGIAIMITSVGLLLSPLLHRLASKRRLSNPDTFKRIQPTMTVIAGIALGLIVALTSIGAGALGSIMLIYLYPLRMTPHRLVATDIAHAIPLAFVAGGAYLVMGTVDIKILINLLIGSIPGIIIGRLLSEKAPGRMIQIFLALALLASSIKTLFF